MNLRPALVLLTLASLAHAQTPAGRGVGKPAAQAPADATNREQMTADLLAADKEGWRAVFSRGQALAASTSDVGFEVVRDHWAKLSDEAKQQLQKAWMFRHLKGGSMHPRLLDVLNLGATDPNPKPRQFAFTYLKQIALEDFSEDIEAYRKWHVANGSRKVEEVVEDSFRRWIEELKSDDVSTRDGAAALARDAVTTLTTSATIRKIATDAGLLDAAEGLTAPGNSEVVVQAGSDILRAINPDRTPAPPSAKPAADAELTKMPTQTVLIGNDKHKRYELIGPREGAKMPEGGYHLLVILPGGDGGADFNPFLRRIALKALPANYIVAQVVAPVWSDKAQMVWPTAKLPDEKMAFPTEQLIREVLIDLKARHAINTQHTYLMGWSSGGPPVYTCVTMPDMPVAGAFVAMSVFKPDLLPALEGAKGRAVYLLHSPTDHIRIDFAKAAEEKLAAAGARTKLTTYQGGHGWKGDVFGEIRRGIQWLETSK